jgi:hypothetical protein
MIVMWHRFGYELAGRNHTIQSSLVVKGSDAVRTAMATTVGLPLGIAARLLLEGSIRTRGVAIPVWPELYIPILAELKQHGIKFFEQRS